MEDHQGQEPNSPSNNNTKGSSERSNEPVRSRWIPKPEQILILESIFNSGMVNPPKEETVRIRKLLEKFGAVGDANVFYWFQNRRSRSRRRQRQLQASLEQRNPIHHQQFTHQYHENMMSSNSTGAPLPAAAMVAFSPSAYDLVGSSSSSSSSSSSCGVLLADDDHAAAAATPVDDHFFSVSDQMGFDPEIQHTSSAVTSVLGPSNTSNFQFQTPGVITVFINGVPTEVPKGPLDMKAMFGEDVWLLHSSGLLLPINEFGFLIQSLQPGESYFLVSRPT